MAIRKIKPTTPGQRGMTVSAFEEITCTKPERSLLEDLKSTGGRNNAGGSTGSSTSSGIRTASPPKSPPSSTIPTAAPTSPCSTMPMAKSATSSRPWACR